MLNHRPVKPTFLLHWWQRLDFFSVDWLFGAWFDESESTPIDDEGDDDIDGAGEQQTSKDDAEATGLSF